MRDFAVAMPVIVSGAGWIIVSARLETATILPSFRLGP